MSSTKEIQSLLHSDPRKQKLSVSMSDTSSDDGVVADADADYRTTPPLREVEMTIDYPNVRRGGREYGSGGCMDISHISIPSPLVYPTLIHASLFMPTWSWACRGSPRASSATRSSKKTSVSVCRVSAAEEVPFGSGGYNNDFDGSWVKGQYGGFWT